MPSTKNQQQQPFSCLKYKFCWRSPSPLPRCHCRCRRFVFFFHRSKYSWRMEPDRPQYTYTDSVLRAHGLFGYYGFSCLFSSDCCYCIVVVATIKKKLLTRCDFFSFCFRLNYTPHPLSFISIASHNVLLLYDSFWYPFIHTC